MPRTVHALIGLKAAFHQISHAVSASRACSDAAEARRTDSKAHRIGRSSLYL